MEQSEHIALGNLAEISSGVTFRSRIEQAAQGTTRLIRLKDITGSGELAHKVDFRISDQPKPHHLLRKGDIIFRPIATITATLIDSDIQDTILAAPLLRIRTDRSKILPEYLVWFLNHPRTQAHLASLSTISTVRGVSLGELKKLEISTPDLQVQKSIGDIHALATREEKLVKLIFTYRSRYVQSTLMRLMNDRGIYETNKQGMGNQETEVKER